MSNHKPIAPAIAGVCLIVYLLAGSAAPARAQALGEVMVTATRTPRALNETLSDVTVIDSRAIADGAATTLPELLQALGGIEIAQNGGAGKVAGIFMRGTKNAQTAILVDGIRLENPLGGGGNLEFLPLSTIERIEIVRGPASSLYGSGAIGGVIQIFTKVGSGPPSPFGSIAYGSQGTSQLRAGLSGAVGQDGATRFSVGVAADRTSGFEATNPSSPFYQADRDGNRQLSFNGSLSHQIDRDWQVGVNLLSTAGRTKYDDQFSTPDTAIQHFESRSLSAYVRGVLTPAWETTLRVGSTQIEYRYDAFTFEPVTDSRTLSWQNTVKLPLGRTLLGYEQVLQSIKGDGVTSGTTFSYLRDSRTTRSLFAGYEAEWGDQLFRIHARQDRIDTVGSEPTGSIAYGYRVTQAWLLRASAGTAFRTPTFDDLYNPFGSNSNLRPEKSRGYELASEHFMGASLFKATLFSSRIREAIELDATFTPQNLDSARVRGLTLEGRHAIGALTLRGIVTFQKAEGEHFDATTGAVVTERLVRRARQFGAFGFDWRTGSWRLGAQWVLQGNRIDNNGERLGGYGLVNLTAAYAVNREWEVFARAGNVGDKNYETAFGYNGTPRNVLIGVRYAAQ